MNPFHPAFTQTGIMKKKLFLLLLTGLFSIGLFAQTFNQPSYAERAVKLLSSFKQDTLAMIQRPFEDTLRIHWARLPGQRPGLKLSYFSETQKIALHELLRSCLSTQGYLTVTAVMFNEDIEEKKQPELGRNQYWVQIFGNPSSDNDWSWKLEGHHLSLNFTFRGNSMISNTPYLMSTNPANSITDSVRAGLVILYKEEELGRALVHSLTPVQIKKGYDPRKKTDIVYSEQNKSAIRVPDEGIYYRELNKVQQELLKSLVAEYFNNFNPQDVTPVNDFCNEKLRFFYVENQEKGKPHYYRLENGKQIIEYENYDNHIHCFYRTNNDFGKAFVK